VGCSRFSRARDRFARLAVGSSAAFGFALVPELLAFGEGDLALHASVLEIETCGDERVSFLLRLPDQLAQLLFVDEELPGAERRVVIDVAVLVGSNVRV